MTCVPDENLLKYIRRREKLSPLKVTDLVYYVILIIILKSSDHIPEDSPHHADFNFTNFTTANTTTKKELITFVQPTTKVNAYLCQ